MDAPPPRALPSRLLTPGIRFLALFLLALPPAVVALSDTGTTQLVSGLIAVGWFAMVPLALYGRRAAQALPFLALAFVGLTVAFLPFNSGAFWTNVCTTAVMFLASLPRQSPATTRAWSSATN